MFSTKKKVTAAITLGLASAFLLSACSMGSGSTTESSRADGTETVGVDAAGDGPGGQPGRPRLRRHTPTLCRTAPGSVEGMSQDPVAVAASNNPLLTTLVAAVSGQLNPDVDLVDTLNGGEFTVFAPVDDALREDRPRHDRGPQDRQRHAELDPDVPRGPRTDRAG